MRIVLAPDSFGPTPAHEVAEIFAQGWQEVAPADQISFAPLSDGGPGFVSVLAFAHPAAEVIWMDATGLTGAPIGDYVVRIADTAYVESAVACGLDQLKRYDGDVRTATTYGVGQLVAAAAALDGVTTVVVGLGGSGTNDGGAGLWAALGAEPADVLRGGGIALKTLDQLALPRSLGVELIAATDVDNPLLGFQGASAVYGPQKGADQAAVMSLDTGLERWANVVEPLVAMPGLRDRAGVGAAGGLGFGLLALGARRVSGVDLVMDAVGLGDQIEGADLVITGEGSIDSTTLRGKVVSGVARLAQEAGVPCVVAAGQSSVGAREAASNGIDEVWSVAERLGSAEAAIAAGPDGIRALARDVARAWSR